MSDRYDDPEFQQARKDYLAHSHDDQWGPCQICERYHKANGDAGWGDD